jgi:hypothetical protein
MQGIACVREADDTGYSRCTAGDFETHGQSMAEVRWTREVFHAAPLHLLLPKIAAMAAIERGVSGAGYYEQREERTWP